MSNLGMLSSSLNALWTDLTTIGVKQMPRLVFSNGDDWVNVITTLPLERDANMLCGFMIELAHKPVNEADRFVAQEIGA